MVIPLGSVQLIRLHRLFASALGTNGSKPKRAFIDPRDISNIPFVFTTAWAGIPNALSLELKTLFFKSANPPKLLKDLC